VGDDAADEHAGAVFAFGEPCGGPGEIDAARGTLHAQLLNVAAIEKAIRIHNAAETASEVCKLYFEYRHRHGYDDRKAASFAFAEVAEGIDAAYEIAYMALSQGGPSPAALERADREQARSARLTTDPDESLESVRGALRQRRVQASSQRSGPVEDALADLADVFGDSMTAVDVGGHMTCTEADAIARALLAGGHHYAAARWLDGHAHGDVDAEDDRHVGDSFDLEAYLDGLRPPTNGDRRRCARGGCLAQAGSTDRCGREPSERGAVAEAAHDREDWAAVIRDLAGAAVVERPAWPGLAKAIERAHAAGWDVRAGVARLVAQQEMPDRHPARELHYRLLSDCPAAMPAPPATRADAQAASATRHPATPPAPGRAAELPSQSQRGPDR
jgi:hypothetical protein